MTNKTQLQTNNTALDALITRVNAAKNTAASLPEAGGGSGGGSVETCAVQISSEYGLKSIIYTGLDSTEQLVSVDETFLITPPMEYTLPEVVVGTSLTIYTGSSSTSATTGFNTFKASLLYHTATVASFNITAGSGEIATITIKSGAGSND